jgi:hypothetical protein
MEPDEQADEVRVWRLEQLRLLGYKRDERTELVILIEAGELDLDDVRKLAARGCPPDLARQILV